MRWDDFFGDLEAEAAELELRARDAEIADRTRAEIGRLSLADRMRAAVGSTVEVRVLGIGGLRGKVRRVTPPWFLLEPEGHLQWLVSWTAVVGVTGLPRRTAAAPPGAVSAALGWPSTWRVLARDRSLVRVFRVDGSVVSGVAQLAAADFVELRSAGGDAPSAGVTGHAEAVPYLSIAAVGCPADQG